jgi:hypothetical protein
MRIRTLLFPLTLLLSVAQLIGCSVNQTEVKVAGDKHAGTVLKSIDGQSELILPSGWKEYRKLNDTAEVQAANLMKNLYIVILTENKDDFNHITLKQHSALTRQNLLKALTSPEVIGPKKLTINGYSAIQFEIKGQLENSKICYLHTTVETTQNFHQILAWTSKSGFEKNREELQQVINSFRETRDSSVKFTVSPPATIDISQKSTDMILKSTDGQSQIILPGGWKEHPKLNDAAQLQASNLTKNLYVVVLTESKEDFDNLSLAEHSAITRNRLLESLTAYEVKGPWNLNIKGTPAIQFEIRGLAKNFNVAYLHTTVETAKNFHQILAWTSKSGFEKNRAELERIIDSFLEIQAGTASR